MRRLVATALASALISAPVTWRCHSTVLLAAAALGVLRTLAAVLGRLLQSLCARFCTRCCCAHCRCVCCLCCAFPPVCTIFSCSPPSQPVLFALCTCQVHLFAVFFCLRPAFFCAVFNCTHPIHLCAFCSCTLPVHLFAAFSCHSMSRPQIGRAHV